MNHLLVKRAPLGGFLILLVVILAAVSVVAFTHLPSARAGGNNTGAIVGAWFVDAKGAPFVPHVAIFHADGTILIDNPEAGDHHTSDSLGAGAWRQDQQHPDRIIGTFEEINADRATGHYSSRLVVTFTLTMQGANAFRGPAAATYFNPNGTKQNDQPYPAQLAGTRILP